MIADEPTTALDVIVQAQILALLTDLVRERGISLIMISHDLSVLAQTCDRIAVMYAGRLVETGPSRDVIADPLHPYTRRWRVRSRPWETRRHGWRPAAWPATRPISGRPWTAARSPRAARSWRSGARHGVIPLRGLDDRAAACVLVPGDELVGQPWAEPTTCRTPPALEARDLGVTFPPRRGHGAARAVDGVNLALARGEVLALIGESGCGKSTLARALVGLIQPTRGEIRYDGRPLVRNRSGLREFRRHVQLVLQDPYGALNPRQNVHDAVAEGLRLHGQRQGLTRRVTEALEQVGMRPPDHFFDRYPHQLSGGQQQRVVIAGALTLGPDVLVADEPVSSLDASVRGEILKLFLGLRDELGLAALVVSHDLGLAWNIADRVAVMYLGRIVEVGRSRRSCSARSTPTRGRCSTPSRRRPARLRAPRCAASRPTRRRSRRGAGSIRAARCAPCCPRTRLARASPTSRSCRRAGSTPGGLLPRRRWQSASVDHRDPSEVST